MIGWTGSQNHLPASELPEIFPFPYLERDFISVDVQNIYSRILTDVLERTQGVPKEMQNLLWDNCVANESSDGLVTLLAKAMTSKSELFLVYESALKVIRKARHQKSQSSKLTIKNKGNQQQAFISRSKTTPALI